jgi:hypothetical protein
MCDTERKRRAYHVCTYIHTCVVICSDSWRSDSAARERAIRCSVSVGDVAEERGDSRLEKRRLQAHGGEAVLVIGGLGWVGHGAAYFILIRRALQPFDGSMWCTQRRRYIETATPDAQSRSSAYKTRCWVRVVDEHPQDITTRSPAAAKNLQSVSQSSYTHTPPWARCSPAPTPGRCSQCAGYVPVGHTHKPPSHQLLPSQPPANNIFARFARE